MLININFHLLAQGLSVTDVPNSAILTDRLQAAGLTSVCLSCFQWLLAPWGHFVPDCLGCAKQHETGSARLSSTFLGFYHLRSDSTFHCLWLNVKQLLLFSKSPAKHFWESREADVDPGANPVQCSPRPKTSFHAEEKPFLLKKIKKIFVSQTPWSR